MMDITEVTRGPIVEREGLKNDFEAKPSETSEDAVDDEKDKCTKNNLKRSLEEDLMNSKKRRKQLKPIRIATNLEDMVKVPKQILGLNNELDNVNDLTHTVPKEPSSNLENSPLLNDVHFPNPLQTGISAGHAANNSSRAIDTSRAVDKSDTTDLNVPNIDMGPNYITNPHFIFPISFQPVKTPGFWSEAKIFNQEAYCDLCKKEFCNKYFLKTHKANKHGIYVDIPTSSAACVSTPITPKIQVRISENGRMDVDCATCDLCNKKFCNKYFVRRHKSKSHGLFEEETQLLLEPDAKIVQSSAHNSTKETDSTLMSSQQPLALVSKEVDYDHDNHNQEGPLNLIVTPKEESDEEERDEGLFEGDGDGDGECSSENIEKLQTMLLRLNPSEIESKAADSFESSEKKEKEYLSEDSSNESKAEFVIPKSENQDYMFVNRLDHLKQMKPTSSYCEICNKELCNKYFMRTHMQRMHGIEIEHGTQIGGVVCNICNKELCSKYFLRVHKQNTHGIMSPNSMLAPSTSTTTPRADPKTSPRFVSNFSQVCYICNKRFRSPKWLQAHFLSDHREETVKLETKEPGEVEHKEEDSNPMLKIPKKAPEESSEPPEALDVISKIFWEKNSASKTYTCSQCPFTTSVLAFLFVHERSHFVLAHDQPEMVKPTVSLQNLIHDKTFWQHKITQQIPECLDLSAGKAKYVSFEQNGS